ncbi:MAG TPA: MFS transporter [Acidimicrobiia bacterium]
MTRAAAIPRLKVAVLGLLTIAAYGCWNYAFGVLLDPIIADTGWSEQFLTRVFGVSVLIGGIGSIVSGWLLDRVGSRVVFLVGAAVTLLTFLTAAAATSPLVFAAAAAVGGGVVAALGFYHVTQTVAVRVTPQASTKAIAVVTVWGAFSSFIYLPLAAWLVQNHGWRPAVVVLSVSAAGAFLVAALTMSTRTASMPRSVHLVAEIRAALRTPAARSFLVSQAVIGIVMGIISAYQVPAMTAAGLSLATASFWAGFRGLSQLLGRLPLMPMVGRFGVVGSMRLSYAAMAVGAVVLAFAGTPVLAATYAVVAGFGIGAISPLVGIHSRDVFGADSLGMAMGAVSLVFQVVGAFGPPLAGFLTGQTGSRSVAVVVAGVLAVVGGAVLRSPQRSPVR